MKKIFWLPPLATLFIAAAQIVFGNFFEFTLWLLISCLLALTFLPIALEANEKDVPVFQVFAPFLLIPIFFGMYGAMDIMRIPGFGIIEVILYSILIGIATIGLTMILKGK